MNREDIYKMEAGKEIEKLIAELVFNLEIIQHDDGPNPPYYCYVDGDNWLAPSVEPYSRDIAAAWRVVEKFLSLNDEHVFHVFSPAELRKEWYAGCGIPGRDGAGHGYADTAQLAICRAALQAMGKQ